MPKTSDAAKDNLKTEGENRYAIGDPAAFARNMIQVGQQSQRLLSDFLKRRAANGGSAPSDPLNLTGAFTALLKNMAANPTVVMEAQFQLWRDYMGLWERTATRMLGGEARPVVTPASGDKRFRDKDWEENQVFDFIKQSYLLTANWMQDTVAKVNGDLDEKTAKRIAFYTRQFADAIAPTNFVMTNPEVLRTTLQSNGENLVKGLNNLLEDLERGEGQLAIRQSADAFRIGENIATAPGKVVFRNTLIELLQFAPETETVYEKPLLIFPPWINKFYILDLRPENSFIRWAVAQGYTVFVASWVNPDRKLARKTFEDYMREGIFEALDAVTAATGSQKVNCIGYCIGGTLLSATLAFMAAKGDERVNSATFFAAQVDFSEAGDLQVFIDDEQLEAMRQQMEAAGGVLEGKKMGTTFNMLRANDLIWSFVVSNYLLGKEPAPFDLLYWNSDTTRMPEATHLFYLREFYKNNALSQGTMSFDNVKLDLSKGENPGLSAERKGRPHRAVPLGLQIHAPVRRPGALHHCRQRPHRRRDQPAEREEVPVLDQRQGRRTAGWKEREALPRHGRRVAGRKPSNTPAPGGATGTSGSRSFPGKKVPARKPGDGKLQSSWRRTGHPM